MCNQESRDIGHMGNQESRDPGSTSNQLSRDASNQVGNVRLQALFPITSVFVSTHIHQPILILPFLFCR